jgi:hypothetical protein
VRCPLGERDERHVLVFQRELDETAAGDELLDRVPTIVIPGNDKTHSMACGHAIQKLIPGSRLVELPLKDQDVPLIPFPEWAPHEETIARACAELVLKEVR